MKTIILAGGSGKQVVAPQQGQLPQAIFKTEKHDKSYITGNLRYISTVVTLLRYFLLNHLNEDDDALTT
ncbi:MAG: hypothetical protein MJA84_06980 [Firmicutes bacterium]|nr:hypothetical protein [Bacillota bacterium]